MFVHRIGLFVVCSLLLLPIFAQSGSTAAGNPSAAHRALVPLGPLGPTATRVRFAFVANFENHKFDGFSASTGTAAIVTSPSYGGEPSLSSTQSGSKAQVDLATQGFVAGAKEVSFQAALSTGGGAAGYVGLSNSTGPLAVVGLSKGSVMAGPTPASAVAVGLIPTSTVQPIGWVLLIANVFAVGSGASARWVMDVYVDRTVHPFASNLSVPGAGNYTGALLETVNLTEDYSDVIFSTYQIATTIPGYNPMEGYGQGSGLYVQLLPKFDTLTATETLANWSVPEAGILSFQINAMNRTGTLRSTCKGFFQLGVDLEPNGRIAPWYVPGINCAPNYFGHRFSWTGFATPNGTQLDLRISDNVTNHTIEFEIVDASVTGANRVWQASIPYSSTEFFGSYTQMEWQPSSHYPIASYFLNGSLDGLQISGGKLSGPRDLGASYMVPFELDAPFSWAMTAYAGAVSGYNETG